MDRIETRQSGTGRDGTAQTQPLREAVTGAAAIGFLIGGLSGLARGGAIDLHPLMLSALYLSLGAAAAAIVTGMAVNLITLPALGRLAPARRLPDAAYRVAAALSALAAFAGAFVAFTPAGP